MCATHCEERQADIHDGAAPGVTTMEAERARVVDTLKA